MTQTHTPDMAAENKRLQKINAEMRRELIEARTILPRVEGRIGLLLSKIEFSECRS